jgi:hypothetical protein
MPTSKGRKPRGSKNRQRDAGASDHKDAEREKQKRVNPQPRDKSGKKKKGQ